MIINNREFPIYELDTTDTILQRIAANNNTLPKYLFAAIDGQYVPASEVVFDSTTRLTIVDMLTDLGNRLPTLTVSAFIRQYGTSDEDYIIWYIIFSLEIADTPEISTALELQLLTAGYTKAFISGVAGRIPAFMFTFNNEVAANKKRSAENTKYFIKMDNVTTSLTNTKFDIEQIKFSFIISLQNNITLLSLLNIARIDQVLHIGTSTVKVLYINVQDYYKTNNNVSDNPNQSINIQDLYDKYADELNALDVSEHLNLVLLYTEKRKRKDRVSFINATCIPNNAAYEVDELIVEFAIDTNISDYQSLKLSIQNFIKNIFFTTTEIHAIRDYDTDKVKGSYSIENVSINKYVFLDMIFNSEYFTSLYTDERNKVTKKSAGIYCYYTNVRTGLVIFSIMNEHPHVKVRIVRINNIEDIPFFQVQLNKLLSIYFADEKAVLDAYTKYVTVPFDTPKSAFKGKRFSLNEKIPELFLPLYSRKCANIPRIVTDEEVKDGFQTMRYPLYQEGGLEPSIYTCDHHPQYPYPGLRTNTLENAGTFPYLPCCYEKDQLAKDKSNYNMYLSGQTQEAIPRGNNVLYKTIRIIPNGTLGILPLNIKKSLMNSTDYYRYGITSSADSIIQCIARAKPSALEVKLSRRDMLPYINLGRQELWEYTTDDIIHWLDSHAYVDPKAFVAILEECFDVSIFLFERSVGKCTYANGKMAYEFISDSDRVESMDGQLVAPYHSPYGSYCIRPLRSRSIIIYTHFGIGSGDTSKHPQCETIVRSVDNKIEQLFDSNSDIIRHLYDLYVSMYTNPVLLQKNIQSCATSADGTKLYNPIGCILADMHLVSQRIDASGKLRAVTVAWNNNHYNIYCNPSHPMNLPIADDTSNAPGSDLVSHFNMTVQSDGIMLYDGTSKCKWTTHYAILQVDENHIIVDLMNYTSSLQERIIFSQYLDTFRIAKVFFEYVLYNAIGASDLDAWAHDNCVIDTTFRYDSALFGLIQIPYFSVFDSIFRVKGKIVFNSSILFAKIMYNIRRIRAMKAPKLAYTISKSFLLYTADFYTDASFTIVYGHANWMRYVANKKQGETFKNMLAYSDDPVFFTDVSVYNGKIFSAICYTDIEDIRNNVLYPASNLKSAVLESTPGEAFVYIDGYTRYDIDYPCRVVAFKIDTGPVYMQLSSFNDTKPSSSMEVGASIARQVIYTDGACSNNGKPNAKAGIGVYWGKDDPRNVSQGLDGAQTNNRAEIHAAIVAINQAKRLGLSAIEIRTDSQLLINAITKWIPNWMQNDWKAANKKPVANKNDWSLLLSAAEGMDIMWTYVKAHSGIEGNEGADALAVLATQ